MKKICRSVLYGNNVRRIEENEIKYPFSDKDATYIGEFHQYELTDKYFQERGRNLEIEIDGNDAEKSKTLLTVFTHKSLSVYLQP